MRLDKYLTQAGIGSRSQVKEYIKKGLVTINGQTTRKSETQLDENSDTVLFQGQEIHFDKYVYYMLHKPADCITATKDSSEKTVMDYFGEDFRKDLFPVGRLDKDTEGLLLVTNDGDLAHKLLSPRKSIAKKYLVHLKKEPTPEEIYKLEHGVDIGEKKDTLPARFSWENKEEKKAYLTITEGKFHQVKRMFTAVDNQVLYLKRMSMGTLLLDESLKPGEYRKLTKNELEELILCCTEKKH